MAREASPVPKGAKMGIMLTVRLSQDDAEHLRRLAKLWRCTFSDAVRAALRITDSPLTSTASSGSSNFSNVPWRTGNVGANHVL